MWIYVRYAVCVWQREGGGGRGIQPLSTANWGLLPRIVDNRNTLPLTLTVRFMLVINTRVQSIYPSFIILQLGVRFTGTHNHFLVPAWCIFSATERNDRIRLTLQRWPLLTGRRWPPLSYLRKKQQTQPTDRNFDWMPGDEATHRAATSGRLPPARLWIDILN